MKTTTTPKNDYAAPVAETIALAQEHVVCASPANAPQFNKPFNNEEQW